MDELFSVLENHGRVEGLDLKVRKKGSESMDCVLSADTRDDSGQCLLSAGADGHHRAQAIRA